MREGYSGCSRSVCYHASCSFWVQFSVSYGVSNAWFVWISPKALRSPVLASFADSKLLDLSRASDSITSRINRTLCVTRYIRYVRINACRAVGTVAIIVDAGTMPSSLTGELLLLRQGFCTIVLHLCAVSAYMVITNTILTLIYSVHLHILSILNRN